MQERSAPRGPRMLAWLLVGIFLFSFYSPSALAIRTLSGTGEPAGASGGRESAGVGGQLARLKRLAERLQEASGRERGPATAGYARLLGLLESVLAARAEVLADLSRQEAELVARQVAPGVIARLGDARQRIDAGFSRLQALYEVALHAQGAQARTRAVEAIARFLDQHPVQPRHRALDPQHLPFGGRKRGRREPLRERRALERRAGAAPAAPTLIASTSLSPMMLAQAGDAPTAADLEPTLDAPITPAIQALADELGGRADRIHAWVRNNVRFVPSYGSIQGAQATLESRRGNAFDTASLLIALLRASGIPARYVYGTVAVPPEQVMNWVGGVSTVAAAQNLMGQGGIPNVAILRNGELSEVELEHVWVEAHVDYTPSRGGRFQQGDRWVPLDASFKQHDLIAPTEVTSQVPFSSDSLRAAIENGSVIDEANGVVSGLQVDAMAAQVSDYQGQVASWYRDMLPGATLEGVLGSARIRPVDADGPLPATLPYAVVVRGAAVPELDDGLRHKLRYVLSTGGILGGSQVFSYTIATAQLAGRQLSLWFRPSTQADEDLLDSLLPAPDPGGQPVPLSAFPTSLPGYLIQVTPELVVDGQVVATGGSFQMGSELQGETHLWDPASGWEGASNGVIAGAYVAIGVDLQGLGSGESLDAKRARLDTIRTKLDDTDVADLTIHDVKGAVLHTAIDSYFAINGAQDEVDARGQGIVQYRFPSFGFFVSDVQPEFLFGVPRNVSYSGLNMDVDLVRRIAVHVENEDAPWVLFNQLAGYRLSAHEHAIPERLFTGPDDPGVAVSAVRALEVAMREGQRVFRITSANLSAALSQVSADAAVESDIARAVNAGMEAIVHEQAVSVGSWVGFGYITTDPATGSGAYRISGGTNGGFLTHLTAFFSGLLDALLKNYRDPNAMFGPYGELKFARIASKISSALTVLTYALTVHGIVTNPDLSVGNKIAQIILQALAAIAIVKGVALIAGFFTPVLGILLAVLFAVLISILVTAIIEALFVRLDRRHRHERWMVA